MDFYVLSDGPSRDYEARVARSLQQQELMAALPRKAGPFRGALARLEAWLMSAHLYPPRHAEAKDGSPA
jgi:hypothetical protein